MLSGIDNVQSAMGTGVDTSSFDASRESMREAEAAIKSFQEQIERLKEDSSTVPPAKVPVEWEGSLEPPTFTTTGIERYEQEIANANSLMTELVNTQTNINANAANVLSPTALSDLGTLDVRIGAIQQRISQIESNPLNMGSDEANADLEHLRQQLAQALQAQRQLNTAADNMDIGAANAAYSQLSSTVSNTERYLRDNVTAQGAFNNAIAKGTTHSNNLVDKLKSVVKMYLGIQGIKMGVSFYKEALEGANAQIEAETKLETVMRQRMAASSEQMNGVKALASAQQALGVVGDEVQLAGAQQLSTFLNTSDALNTLIPAMNNLAVQQNGVNVTSENMASIGNMVGKVMQGQTSALTRVGITFSEAQEEALKYGNEQERAAVLAQIITDNVGEMNAAMANTPEGQIKQISNTWGDMKETIGNQLYPVVLNLFKSINTSLPAAEPILHGITSAAGVLVMALTKIINGAAAVSSFFSNNWTIIKPIILGIVAALVAYLVVAAIVNTINGVMAVAETVKAAAQAMATGATFAETAAQYGLNAALAACPLTWIILLIIALIAIIFAVCSAIAKFTGIADSGFGVVCGGVMVVIAFFKNLGLAVANIAIGIGKAIGAVCTNIMTAFHNAICSVQSWWYDLLSTAMSVIERICIALNKLPFVEFDYSGITSAANDYAAKAAVATGNKDDYVSVGEAFSEGMGTFDTFQDGWASDAFAAGAAWGDSKAEALDGMLDDMFNPATNVGEDALNGLDTSDFGADLKDPTDTTAKNTKKIADNTKKSDDILSMIKDSISRERIANYTTKQVNVDMSGMSNQIASSLSIVDVVNAMENEIARSAAAAVEGV